MDIPNKFFTDSLKLIKRFEGPIEKATPIQKQTKVLRQLINKSRQTALGLHYNFGQIGKGKDMIVDFQQKVPVHDYNLIHEKWWYRCLEGEPDVCWKGKVKYFALSSGTTGASSKYIPLTPDMLRSMRITAIRMFSCLPKFHLPLSFYTKGWLMIGSTASLKNYGNYFAGDLSGINASKPPLWIRRFYKPGKKIAKLPAWEDRVLQIARNAKEWDISIIAGIPSWVQLTLEKVIEYHKVKHIHEIWPHLKLFFTGGIAFEPYRKSFEQLLGQEIIYMDSYLASEGFIAFQCRPGTNAMELQLNNGIFYEFAPFDEEHFDDSGLILPNIKPLTISEVKENVDYALLISTCAGAWRYQIGDTVKFTDMKRHEIIITGRTKHFLSLCGEHISVDNLNHAVLAAEQQLDVNILEFTVGGKKAGSHYRHHWYMAGLNGTDKKQIEKVLDMELKKLNDDYAAERGAMLRPPKVTVIPNQLFYEWQRVTGKLTGQSKIPRVMKGDMWEEWQRFVEDYL